MATPSLQVSLAKLAAAGEQAGFTVKQMIRLLNAGLTIEDLLYVISQRLEPPTDDYSSRWIM